MDILKICTKEILQSVPGADLNGADLARADLTAANLTYADLTAADLTGANLTAADLTGANLTAADLTGANLRGADLTGANLRGADLTGANLRGAHLTLTILDGVKISWSSHDLIAELLRRAAGESLEHLSFAGLVLVQRQWCWPEFLRLNSSEVQWALDVLSQWVQPNDVVPKCLQQRCQPGQEYRTHTTSNSHSKDSHDAANERNVSEPVAYCI